MVGFNWGLATIGVLLGAIVTTGVVRGTQIFKLMPTANVVQPGFVIPSKLEITVENLR